jgi:hypothetical protein
MEEILFTFYNTHHSIMAEQMLLDAKIPVKVMPMPEAITAGCGLCLRIQESDSRFAFQVLDQGGITPRGMFKKISGEYTNIPMVTFQL